MSSIFRPLTIPPQAEAIVFVVSPDDNDATVKTNIPGVIAMPFAMTITNLRLDVGTAPTGANLLVDMNWNDLTAMSSVFTVQAGHTSSTTATVPPILLSSTLSANTKVTFDIDQVGATVKGKFLQVTLIGVRA